MGDNTLAEIVFSPVGQGRSRWFIAALPDSFSCRQIAQPAVQQAVVERKWEARLVPYVYRDLAEELDGGAPQHGVVIDLEELHRYSHQGGSSRRIAGIV